MALSDILVHAEDDIRACINERPDVYDKQFNSLLLKYMSAIRMYYDMPADGSEVEMLTNELTKIKNKLDIAIKEIA